jgi:hypothetical protein
MAAALGILTQQIEGGHDLMITSPDALASALIGESCACPQRDRS